MDDMVDSIELGSRIRKYRQNAGLSQEKLAEMVGVSSQQMQKYESGQTTLNIIKLQKIAKTLKVSVCEFFAQKPVEHVTTTMQEEELLSAFRKVKNIEMRNCLLKLVSNINKRIK
ncbi:MAG: XRE family transcriptional [Geobacteraceae bacterium]|nr:MAG: XRE family transcriptional [Geobacteraceae bacterium]